MRIRTAAISCLLAAATQMHAADPQLVGLVMPGPAVLAGINVQQAKSSPFGAYVLARMEANEQSLQQLDAATGFDPRRDLREVLVASTTPPSKHQPGLVLARGTFDAARIAAAAAQKGATTGTYHGVTLVTDDNKGSSVAFPDSTLAIAGPTADVQAAVDRLTAPTSLDPAVAVKVNQLSTMQDAWALSLVPPPVPRMSNPNLPGVLGNVAEKITQANGGVKFGANVQVSVEAIAGNAQDAQNLAIVVRMLASLAQANSQANPDLTSLLGAMMVTTDATSVKLSLTVPEDQFERIVHMKHSPRQTARR